MVRLDVQVREIRDGQLWWPPHAQVTEQLLGDAQLEVAGSAGMLHRIERVHQRRLHCGFGTGIRCIAKARPPAVGLHAVRTAGDAENRGLLRIVQHERVDSRDNRGGHLHVDIPRPTLPHGHAACAELEELAEHCVVVRRLAVGPQSDTFRQRCYCGRLERELGRNANREPCLRLGLLFERDVR